MALLKLQSNRLPIILAIYFTLVFNISFFSYFINILKKLDSFNLYFVISVVISFIAAFNLIFSLINIKYINKPLIIFLILVSSIISYEQYFYGVVFNDDMIDNIIQSNFGEGIAYLNFSILCWFIITGLIPSIILYKTRIIYLDFKQSALKKIISCVVSVIIIICSVSLYYISYISVGRNNSRIVNLPVPTYFFHSVNKYIQAHYFLQNNTYKKIGLDAKNNNVYDGKNNLLIILVGETARSMNYQLNGYKRPTNLYTKDLNLISFKNVFSCGTSTSISVPCMFSNLPRSEYSKKMADTQDNLLDIMQHAGLNTLWIDNDSGCKGVCKNIKSIKIKPTKNQFCDGIYCVDEMLLEQLQTQIDNLKKSNKDSIIVLHLIGSHGPAYYKRYPKAHKYFKPDCSRSDIQNCTPEQLINSYDNTILYTDYIIYKTIEILKNTNKLWHPALLYISDHGESLGENGLYLHGTPYFMAPKEQITVPFIIWSSDSFTKKNKLDLVKLKQRINNNYSHDNFFSSVLGLMQIKTNVYNKNLDIFYNNLSQDEKQS